MGLKSFHIVFIALSIALVFGFSYWAFTMYERSQAIGYNVTMWSSSLIGILLLVYAIFFIRKTREI